MLLLSGYLAYAARKTDFIRHLDIVSNVFYEIPNQRYFLFIVVMSLLWLVFFKVVGLYDPRAIKKFLNQINKIFLGCTLGIAAVIIFLFFRREFLFSSRFILLAAWILSIVLIVSGRSLVRIIHRLLLRFKIAAKTVIIVGSDRNTEDLISQLKAESRWGYMVTDRAFTLEQLAQKAPQSTASGVILADLTYSHDKVNDFLEFCQSRHLDFYYAPDIFSAHLHNISMEEVAGFPLIEIKRTPLEGWGRVKKRSVDMLLSVLALIIILIPSIIIALLIKLTSAGPVFVALKRVGEQHRIFRIIKFRSMVKDAHLMKPELINHNERSGPLFKMKNDPRITKGGRFLRRFSLDELPNFYNVLIGHMSLVGPRPHEPEEVGQYQPRQQRLLNIKPGITGLAQISGRSNLPFDEEARLDLYYIENWNLKLDFTILLKTPFAVLFKRDGAV